MHTGLKTEISSANWVLPFFVVSYYLSIVVRVIGLVVCANSMVSRCASSWIHTSYLACLNLLFIILLAQDDNLWRQGQSTIPPSVSMWVVWNDIKLTNELTGRLPLCMTDCLEHLDTSCGMSSAVMTVRKISQCQNCDIVLSAFHVVSLSLSLPSTLLQPSSSCQSATVFHPPPTLLQLSVCHCLPPSSCQFNLPCLSPF